jgi:dTMP kinase
LLAERRGALLTREPGGTPVGEKIRAILLDPSTGVLDPRAEALLVAADRAHHVATVVRPALAEGRDVVSDRYLGSSLAYQGHGRGLPVKEVADLSAWATDDLWPDLVILLDLSPEEAAARLGADRDRFESEHDAFHDKVTEGYRKLAKDDPDRWVVIDGSGPIEEVAERVAAAVDERLP